MERKCKNCLEWERESLIPVPWDLEIADCKVAKRILLPESVTARCMSANAGHTCQFFKPLEEEQCA